MSDDWSSRAEDIVRSCEAALNYAQGAERLVLMERLADANVTMGNFERALELYGIVEAGTSEAEEKARMLRKSAKPFLDKGLFDKCIDAARRGVSTLGGQRNCEMGRLLNVQGSGHMRKSEYDVALGLFRDAIGLFEEMNLKNSDMANALRAIGLILFEKDEYDEARSFYEKSMDIMEAQKDEWGVAAALNNMGLVHYAKGDMDDALGCFLRCRDIMEKRGDNMGISVSLRNIGLIHYAKGDLDIAMDFLDRGLNVSEKLGEKWNVANMLETIGGVKRIRGDLDGAIMCYTKSLALCWGTGNKRITVYNICGIAEAKLGKKDYRDALDKGEEALRVSLEIGAKNEQGVSRRVIGMAYRDTEDLEKAEDEFLKAEEISREIGNRETLAQTMFEHGLLLHSAGKKDEAEEMLAQARNLFSDMGMRLWKERCVKAIEDMDK